MNYALALINYDDVDNRGNPKTKYIALRRETWKLVYIEEKRGIWKERVIGDALNVRAIVLIYLMP